MSSNQTNLLQGTLDLLILKSLKTGELHGLGASRRIDQITRGTFQVKPGSLFPAPHRLEEAGWLTSFWGMICRIHHRVRDQHLVSFFAHLAKGCHQRFPNCLAIRISFTFREAADPIRSCDLRLRLQCLELHPQGR
jgi:hypothetical protein